MSRIRQREVNAVCRAAGAGRDVVRPGRAVGRGRNAGHDRRRSSPGCQVMTALAPEPGGREGDLTIIHRFNRVVGSDGQTERRGKSGTDRGALPRAGLTARSVKPCRLERADVAGAARGVTPRWSCRPRRRLFVHQLPPRRWRYRPRQSRRSPAAAGRFGCCRRNSRARRADGSASWGWLAPHELAVIGPRLLRAAGGINATPELLTVRPTADVVGDQACS